MPSQLNWSEHLVAEKMRSKDDWQTRIPSDWFSSLKQIGALEMVEHPHLNDFEGIFNFDRGILRYRLEVESDKITALPIDGGEALSVNQREIVFKAKPDIFLRKILSANLFNELNVDSNLSPLVKFAERIIEEKKFLLVICLDSKWLDSAANQSLIRTASIGCANTIIISPSGCVSLPHLIMKKISFSQELIPNVDTNFKISRELYCALRFGLSTAMIVSLYKEKKIIVDATSNKIFIFGYEIKLETDSYPYKYLLGLCAIIGSECQNDYFAKTYLKYHDHDIDGTVRRARAQVRQALKKAILKEPEYKIAESLCMPSTPVKTVKSGFNTDDIFFLER